MTVGVFGKLSGIGDFVRFDLPRGFVELWDSWLQQELPLARQTLGARWEECYMSAPIWRFSLAPAVAGQGMVGILMASVDRVGRQFPLTLAMPCQGDPGAVHLNAGATFERLEDIALATLEELPLDRLKARLEDVPQVVAAEITASGPDFMALSHTADLAPAVAAPHLSAPCVWSARIGDGMRAFQGTTLPRNVQFTALFDLTAAPWAGVKQAGAEQVGAT